MTYFFDNCISYRLARMLAALGVDAVALRDRFHPDIDDISLFEALRGSDVVYVSNDMRQTTRRHEALALKEARITAIYFGPFWQKLGAWEQAVWLVRRWPAISGFAEAVDRGTCAEVKQNGKIGIMQ